MKRIALALSFAVLAAPALAEDRVVPYEQPQVDRGIVNERLAHGAATSGAATGAARAPQSPWANDWNFIAPAP